jgi:hypothetical protein
MFGAEFASTFSGIRLYPHQVCVHLATLPKSCYFSNLTIIVKARSGRLLKSTRGNSVGVYQSLLFLQYLFITWLHPLGELLNQQKPPTVREIKCAISSDL